MLQWSRFNNGCPISAFLPPALPAPASAPTVGPPMRSTCYCYARVCSAQEVDGIVWIGAPAIYAQPCTGIQSHKPQRVGAPGARIAWICDCSSNSTKLSE